MRDYDIFKNEIIQDGVSKAGYILIGQIIYDMQTKKAYDDKLEVLFNKMRMVLNKSDAVSSINTIFHKFY
jgi:hypothetical protein